MHKYTNISGDDRKRIVVQVNGFCVVVVCFFDCLLLVSFMAVFPTSLKFFLLLYR